MKIMNRKIFLIIQGIFLVVLISSSVSILAHSGQEPTTTDEPVSLSLEVILLITISAGLLLLVVISKRFGIDDTGFLMKIGVIALVLLLLDYTYIRFFR